jgi:hypothetical protein
MWGACRRLSLSTLATSSPQPQLALLSPLPPPLFNVCSRSVKKTYRGRIENIKRTGNFRRLDALVLPFFWYLVGAPQISLHEPPLLESSWLIRLLTFSCNTQTRSEQCASTPYVSSEKFLVLEILLVALSCVSNREIYQDFGLSFLPA